MPDAAILNLWTFLDGGGDPVTALGKYSHVFCEWHVMEQFGNYPDAQDLEAPGGCRGGSSDSGREVSAMTQRECWHRDFTRIEEAIRPFVVWEPFPHPSDATPARLLRVYKNLTSMGYANGWL